MMNIINTLTISARVLILCLVPTVGLLLIGINKFTYEKIKVNESYAVSNIIHLMPAISNLVHELQKERGVSAGFLSSNGKSFKTDISIQRDQTDKALKLYVKDMTSAAQKINNPFFKSLIQKNRTVLDQLNDKRKAVDSFSIKVSEMASYYTPLIADLLSMVEKISLEIENGEILRSLKSYTSLLQAKERAGLERAMGASGFGTGKFKTDIYKRFIHLGGMQDAFFKDAIQFSDKSEQRKLQAIFESPEQQKLNALRKQAIEAPFGGDISEVSGAQWFSASTAVINLLKQAEDKFIRNILSKSDQIYNTAFNSLLFVSILMVIMLLITLITSFTVIKSIVPPLKQLVINMNRLAKNDTFIDCMNTYRHDEIGHMQDAVLVFRDNAIERSRLREESAQDQLMREKRQEKIDNLIKTFRENSSKSIESFVTNAGQMKTLANTLDNIANATAEKTDDTTVVTGQASGSVQAVASATEEMTASISAINEQVTKANELVTDATQHAYESNNKIHRLATAAEKIGSVVALIQDIAEQTNLLALNATIEAARAGESGKGFAVVASEVKTLASQTAKATEEISNQVSDIQFATTGSVEGIEAISLKMADVSQFTTAISASIEEQGAAISEIAMNIQLAAGGTREVVENIESVSASVNKTRSSVSEVIEASTSVTNEATGLTNVIDDFLKEVSAA